MAALEAKYLDATGIKSLKVRHNNILGFYVEVPAAQAKPLLSEPLACKVPAPSHMTTTRLPGSGLAATRLTGKVGTTMSTLV